MLRKGLIRTEKRSVLGTSKFPPSLTKTPLRSIIFSSINSTVRAVLWQVIWIAMHDSCNSNWKLVFVWIRTCTIFAGSFWWSPLVPVRSFLPGASKCSYSYITNRNPLSNPKNHGKNETPQCSASRRLEEHPLPCSPRLPCMTLRRDYPWPRSDSRTVFSFVSYLDKRPHIIVHLRTYNWCWQLF